MRRAIPHGLRFASRAAQSINSCSVSPGVATQLAAIHKPAESMAKVPTPAYTGTHETDLFGNSLPSPTGKAQASQSEGAGLRGDVQPADRLRDTPKSSGVNQMKFNDKPTLEDAWWAEVEEFGFDDDDFRTAECAELADELDLFRIQALADPNYYDTMYDWDCYVVEHSLWLPLEQCCNDGVLLPMGQRELRVKSCPLEMRDHLGYFFGHCPAHVKHSLALIYWVVVRIDRARRTGNPEWRPEKAPPRPPFHDTVFFRPPILTVRKYGR